MYPTEETRLPYIVDFDGYDSKINDWDNILTAHVNDHFVQSWSMKNLVLGKHSLKTTDDTPAKVYIIKY